ncbi:TLC domain-containing protein [Mycena floridula]|nr:TLC domain-containing protein [Mycena floridula]
MISLDAQRWLPPYLVPFFYLSYPTETPQHPDSFPDSSYYETGLLDICLVITCIAVLALLRDFFRLAAFEPFASWVLHNDLEWRQQQATASNGKEANGNSSVKNAVFNRPKELRKVRRSVLRFAEQGWSALYYPLQLAFGLYVHSNLPTKVLAPTALWIGYPHMPLAAPIKMYYLLQTAFYLHQVLILNAEARRKDHWQMMTHHIITIFLVGGSYSYNFTRVGCLVMVLMDWCDIFLPIAKMMRYIGVRQLFCDTMFGLFLVSWFITRHILFMFVIVSAVFLVPRSMPFVWDPTIGSYLSTVSFGIFCGCLVILEILQILWFVTIWNVAYRVLTTSQGASDDRSDDEISSDGKDE